MEEKIKCTLYRASTRRCRLDVDEENSNGDDDYGDDDYGDVRMITVMVMAMMALVIAMSLTMTMMMRSLRENARG